MGGPTDCAGGGTRDREANVHVARFGDFETRDQRESDCRVMPQHRRNSAGQVEGEHLEEITEGNEYDEQQMELTCSAPKDFQCLRGVRAEHIFDLSTTVRLVCSNARCSQSR